jgi:hypothetical protein
MQEELIKMLCLFQKIRAFLDQQLLDTVIETNILTYRKSGNNLSTQELNPKILRKKLKNRSDK